MAHTQINNGDTGKVVRDILNEELTRLEHTTGTNTGDQDLSGYAEKSDDNTFTGINIFKLIENTLIDLNCEGTDYATATEITNNLHKLIAASTGKCIKSIANFFGQIFLWNSSEYTITFKVPAETVLSGIMASENYVISSQSGTVTFSFNGATLYIDSASSYNPKLDSTVIEFTDNDLSESATLNSANEGTIWNIVEGEFGFYLYVDESTFFAEFGFAFTLEDTVTFTISWTNKDSDYMDLTDISLLSKNYYLIDLLDGYPCVIQQFDANGLSIYVLKETGKSLTDNNLTNALKSNYDTAYIHSQSAHAPVNAVTLDDLTNFALYNDIRKFTSINHTEYIGGGANENRHFGIFQYNRRSGQVILIYRKGSTHLLNGRIYLGMFDVNMQYDVADEVEITEFTTAMDASTNDLRNIAGGYTKSGRLFIFYSEYTDSQPTYKFRYAKVSYSDDDGDTWTTPVTLLSYSDSTHVWNTYGKIVELEDGTLIMPYNVRNRTGTIYYSLRYWQSTDNGLNWLSSEHIGIGQSIDDSNTTYAGETFLCKLTGNIIIGLTRLTTTAGGYRQYISLDGGVTWENQGSTTFESFGNTSVTNQPCSLRTFNYLGEVWVSCVYVDRMNTGYARWVYAKASELLTSSLGAAAWRTATIKQWNSQTSFGTGLAHGYGNELDNGFLETITIQVKQPSSSYTNLYFYKTCNNADIDELYELISQPPTYIHSQNTDVHVLLSQKNIFENLIVTQFVVLAEELIPRFTNGAYRNLSESTTNKVMNVSLDYDAATIEYANCKRINFPTATFKFRIIWKHQTTDNTNNKVSWSVEAQLISLLSTTETDDEPYCTPVISNVTGSTGKQYYISAESAVVTPSGDTFNTVNLLRLQISRVATDGTNDTLTEDAQIVAIILIPQYS